MSTTEEPRKFVYLQCSLKRLHFLISCFRVVNHACFADEGVRRYTNDVNSLGLSYP